MCLHLYGVSVPQNLTREDRAILRSNCFSGHPPKIRARTGAQKWSHRYEAWSSLGHLVDTTWWVERSRNTPKGRNRDQGPEGYWSQHPAQITLLHKLFPGIWGELWKSWGDYFKADRHWGPRALLMSRMTSNICYQLEELWRNLRHRDIKQNVQHEATKWWSMIWTQTVWL